jgi:hypothetical protein
MNKESIAKIKQAQAGFRIENEKKCGYRFSIWLVEHCQRSEGLRGKSQNLYMSYVGFMKLNDWSVMSIVEWSRWMQCNFQRYKSNGVYYQGVDLR